MTIKTYKTRELKGFSVHVFIEGETLRRHISFKRGCTLGSTATFVTSDEKVQKALEELGSFGVDFYIHKEEKVGEDVAPINVKIATPKVEEPKPEEEKEEEVVDVLDAQTFKNLVELRNALIAKGVDASTVTNVKAAENLARKNGYNYTVEKKA